MPNELIEVAASCACAHCDVVTACVLGCGQQSLLRTTGSFAPAVWQRCADFLRQHAWGGAARPCITAGTNVPASASNNTSLAVSRCMCFGSGTPS